MGIAVDASSPPTVTTTGNTTATITTASFTPPASSLLVAVANVGYNGSTQDTVFNITDSLSGTWSNDAIEFPSSGGVPQSLVASRVMSSSSSMTVTLNTSTHQKCKQLTVFVLTGTLTSSYLGGHAVSTTTMDGSVTTTQVGSIVLCGAAYDSNSTFTPDAHTTTQNHLADSTDSISAYIGQSTSLTTTPGATTYGWTGTFSTNRSWAGAEYLPAPVGAPRPIQVINQAINRSVTY